MTVEIKHNQSFWEQGPQTAEEIHAVQQLQTGLYNIRSDTHIGITWEENERDAVFVLYMLEGEMQFQSSSEVFSLKKDDSALFSYEATAIHGISKTPCRLMLFSTSGSYQKVNATNACFEKLREVELKDIYTIGHSRRVSSLSMSIALQLDPGYDILTLGAAATFHDLGKYYTPIEILQKPGRLTPEEFSIIKLHPQASWQLLMESHGEIIAEIALQHHERMDGSGYPRGLHADAIRMDARIIAVADVFDAITSKRSYNNPVSYEQALSIMEQEQQLYDSDVLHALHILVREKRLSISI